MEAYVHIYLCSLNAQCIRSTKTFAEVGRGKRKRSQAARSASSDREGSLISLLAFSFNLVFHLPKTTGSHILLSPCTTSEWLTILGPLPESLVSFNNVCKKQKKTHKIFALIRSNILSFFLFANAFNFFRT